jgi:hypothetical protein
MQILKTTYRLKALKQGIHTHKPGRYFALPSAIAQEGTEAGHCGGVNGESPRPQHVFSAEQTSFSTCSPRRRNRVGWKGGQTRRRGKCEKWWKKYG